MSSEFERYHNKAFGFYDGRDSRNNVVSLSERHVTEKTNGIAFLWGDPKKTAWGDNVTTGA
ncbi:MAG: hypothetical protein WA705_21695 [Candidatus Ozemobacteraceae bacterium]